jgi:uncharacterized membrane protein
MKNIKNKENEWKIMPVSFKIIFVLFLIELVTSLLQFNQISENDFFLLGIFLTGTVAGITMFLFNIMGIIFFNKFMESKFMGLESWSRMFYFWNS